MNHKNSVKIILVVAVLLVVSAVGYFTLLKKDESIVRQSPPESISKDETADWKTTINDGLGYSIKYPTGWKAETNNKITTLTNLSNSEQVIAIGLNSTNANPNKLSINEWLKTQQWPDPKPISEQFKSIANVDGVNAVEQVQTGTAYFTKGINVFTVENGISFERKVVDEKLFLQILSTFKFTK